VLDLIECGRGKLNDAAVMSWALRWYEQIQLAAPQYCRPMEEVWFHTPRRASTGQRKAQAQ